MVPGAQSLVELGLRFHEHLPRSRPATLAAAEPQSDRPALRTAPRFGRAPRAANWSCTAASITPFAASANTSTRTAPGARATPAYCARGQLRISLPNSACTSRFRFIPEVSEFSPAITSRAHPTWGFRWSASGCFTDRDISASGWTKTAGSRRSISRRTSARCRWSRRLGSRANRSPFRSKRAAAPSTPKCGV